MRSTTTSPLYALEGSLASTQRYVQDDPASASWTPTRISFVVEDGAGTPLPGCDVQVVPTGTPGWFFPDSATTTASGVLSGWWIAGRGPSAGLTARVARTESTFSEATISAEVFGDHRNLAPAPYLSFTTPASEEYTIDATPRSDPDFTYYQVIGWRDSYTGLQVWNDYGGHLAIWSLWDVGGVSAEVVVAPAGSNCGPFGGYEGTGIQCLFPYPWVVGRTYRFRLVAAHTVADRTDYTLSMTEVDTGTTTTVGTLRYGAAVWIENPGTFLEQFAGDQFSCLDSQQRMVHWSNIQYRPVGASGFETVTRATFTRPYDPAYGHGSLCFNYDHGVEGSAFFTSTGGLRAGRPCGPEVAEPCPEHALP